MESILKWKDASTPPKRSGLYCVSLKLGYDCIFTVAFWNECNRRWWDISKYSTESDVTDRVYFYAKRPDVPQPKPEEL